MANGGNLILGLLVLFVYFLIASAIIMALWNGPVMQSVSTGSVKKIDFVTSMGLTLFFMLVLGTPLMVVTKY